MRTPHLVAILLFLLPGIAQAQLPRTLGVQGALTDNGGRPLPDGTHTVRIGLYATASGGAALHTETFSPQLRGGVFSVVLGAATPIPAGLTFDVPYWLGFAVDGGAELAPRTPLTSVPYALHAGTSLRAKEADHAAAAATAVAAEHAASADVASSLAIGATGVVTSLNGAEGNLTLQGGGGTIVARNGSTITITSSGGGGSGISGIRSADGTIAIQNPDGPIATVGVAPQGITAAQLAPGAVTPDKIATNGAAAGQILTVTGPNAAGWAAPPQGGGFSLPFADTIDTPKAGMSIHNKQGRAMLLVSQATTAPALEVLGGAGIHPGIKAAGDNGSGIIATSNSAPGIDAFSANGAGAYAWSFTGFGLQAYSRDSYGVYANSSGSYPIMAENSTSYATVYGRNTGSGSGILGNAESGSALVGISGSGPGVNAASTSGAGLRARSQSGDIILAYSGSTITQDLEMKLTNTGDLRIDGTVHTGGADLAEAIDAEGGIDRYEPGDVMVISSERDRTVTRSSEPNATNVAGVYATKPGMLLSTAGAEDETAHLLPLGVIGIVPTKVCGENGPILRGDLLVTSSTPGHAMKALPSMVGGVAVYPTGAVLGKALENFEGPGTGRIEVLVNVQ